MLQLLRKVNKETIFKQLLIYKRTHTRRSHMLLLCSFAQYTCRICNLYVDTKEDIYHCPFCNVCRSGKGLGVDFRHCMRCNACVSINEGDKHTCINQTLGGLCCICREDLFNSTLPLKKLKCGHVMHLGCYSTYMKTSYRCPICKKRWDDEENHLELFLLPSN